MKTKEIARQQPTDMVQRTMEILSEAVLRGDIKVDVIERLVAMQGDMLDRHAKQEFAAAFARFKENVPVIVKDAKIEVKGTLRSRYAKLDQVAEKVIPCLLAEGITHRWKTRTGDDGRIFVRCYLRHTLGYEEEGSTLSFGADNSGSMNGLQGLGSTVSYLERYTFIASCGIVIKDWDNDANALESLSDDERELVLGISRAESQEELKVAYKNAGPKALSSTGPNRMTLVKLVLQARDAKSVEFSAKEATSAEVS